ncbi:MAG: YezD family protein [Firmicutes bacterium]|nr:YezD family protein [Bacillota bacterium]
MGEKNAIRRVTNQPSLSAEHLRVLMDMVASVKYGSITLIIQDGVVIQIDKNEKLRLK